MISKYVMVIALSIGLVLPMMGAVLVEFMPGVTSFVICTGDGTIVLTIDANGDPVETPVTETQNCVFDGTQVAVARQAPFWQVLARDFTVSFVATPVTPVGGVFYVLPPSQAPPVFI